MSSVFDHLPPQHRDFAIAYAETSNAMEAARAAGYTGSNNALSKRGVRLKNRPEIATALEESFRPKLKEANVATYRTLQEIADIAYAPWQDFITVSKSGEVKMDLQPKLRALIKLSKIVNQLNAQKREDDLLLNPCLELHFKPGQTPTENRQMLLDRIEKSELY